MKGFESDGDEKMSKKRLNNGYSHYFDRCSNCIHLLFLEL